MQRMIRGFGRSIFRSRLDASPASKADLRGRIFPHYEMQFAFRNEGGASPWNGSGGGHVRPDKSRRKVQKCITG
jgi:hypothetical protein